MAGFGLEVTNGSAYRHQSQSLNGGKKLPPPLASSTPKKRLSDSFGGAFGRTDKSSRANGINGDESPLKKRKVVYMDENEEDHGESLVVNGRATGKGGKVHAMAKGPNKFEQLQEQRRQLPIAKGLSPPFTLVFKK